MYKCESKYTDGEILSIEVATLAEAHRTAREESKWESTVWTRVLDGGIEIFRLDGEFI